MFKFLAISIYLALLIFTILIVSGCAHVNSCKNKIKGEIIDSRSQNPVKDALVLVYFNSGGFWTASSQVEQGMSITDSNGQFEIPEKCLKLKIESDGGLLPEGYQDEQYLIIHKEYGRENYDMTELSINNDNTVRIILYNKPKHIFSKDEVQVCTWYSFSDETCRKIEKFLSDW